MEAHTGPETTALRRGGRLASGLAGRAAVVLALLAIVLAACGGGAGAGGAPAPPPQATATPAAEEAAPESGTEATAAPAAEKTGPNFSFTLYQGENELGAGELDLHRLQGKPLVLNFWAGLCPPCRAEMPDLQEFYEEYKDRVTLLGIDLGPFTQLGSRDDAKALLEELDITYPAGYTDDNAVIPRFRVLGMPTTVFVDADGGIVSVWGGVLTADTLRERANQMLGQ